MELTRIAWITIAGFAIVDFVFLLGVWAHAMGARRSAASQKSDLHLRQKLEAAEARATRAETELAELRCELEDRGFEKDHE